MFKDIRAEAEEYIYKKLVRLYLRQVVVSKLLLFCVGESDE